MMALSGSIEDRLQIQDLYARYASASSRGDRAAWLDCWAEDAVWVSHLFECAGREAVATQYDAVMALFDNLSFIAQLGPIAIDGDTARASATAMEIATYKTGGFFKLVGNYDDTLVRRDSAWTFLRRDYLPAAQDF